MTNVRPTKNLAIRKRLKEIAAEALAAQGWKIERLHGSRKSSERQITNGSQSLRVTVKTSQDEWLAFPLSDKNDIRFGPLANADRVIVSALDPDDSRYALVFDFPADDIRRRFEDALKARQEAGLVVRDDGGGMWVSLFRKGADRVYHVGGGVALDYKPLARVALNGEDVAHAEPVRTLADTIAAAKRQIAAVAGISPEQVRIAIEA